MEIIILHTKTDLRIKKVNDELSKQIVTKINDKIQTKFPYKKKLVYSDHHELGNFPIGVENQGTSACFFNSVMQILLSSLRNNNEQRSHDNQLAIWISDLLEDIKSSSTFMIFSKYVQNLGLSNFVWKSTDAHECLIHILGKCYKC